VIVLSVVVVILFYHGCLYSPADHWKIRWVHSCRNYIYELHLYHNKL